MKYTNEWAWCTLEVGSILKTGWIPQVAVKMLTIPSALLRHGSLSSAQTSGSFPTRPHPSTSRLLRGWVSRRDADPIRRFTMNQSTTHRMMLMLTGCHRRRRFRRWQFLLLVLLHGCDTTCCAKEKRKQSWWWQSYYNDMRTLWTS